MPIFVKSISILLVLILIMSSAIILLGQLIIEMANALDNESLDLTISCRNMDRKCYLLYPSGFHEWINNGATTIRNPPFLCSSCLTCTLHLVIMIVKSFIGMSKKLDHIGCIPVPTNLLFALIGIEICFILIYGVNLEYRVHNLKFCTHIFPYSIILIKK